MNMNRRKFITRTAAAGATAALLTKAETALANAVSPVSAQDAAGTSGPVVLSTWDFKVSANETAYGALQRGLSALEAVEQGINVVEADPKITSVGRGGYPDRDGFVTLDACVMDQNGAAGSVMCIEHIVHPISVAKKVMENTPHVVLVGAGALEFALAQGYQKEELLTPEAKKAYEDWLKTSGYNPPLDSKNHDTIGMIVMDGKGNLAGGCSTSGAAWKMRGRVGDSPIIGAGLYVDNEIGAATSTGLGEAVIKVAGSFLIVEAMRNGKTPQEACKMALQRVVDKQPMYKDIHNFLVGFVAINKKGEVGACSYRKGLQYSLLKDGVNKVYDAEFMVS
jgi:N4-(beta-N-acetylglucosaminyl)-L-asparaginase